MPEKGKAIASMVLWSLCYILLGVLWKLDAPSSTYYVFGGLGCILFGGLGVYYDWRTEIGDKDSVVRTIFYITALISLCVAIKDEKEEILLFFAIFLGLSLVWKIIDFIRYGLED